MNVLVIGSGGREHALTWAIAKSPSVSRVFVAPGNPGTEGISDSVRNVPLDLSTKGHEEVARFCHQNAVDLVVVGPENPLADGIADHLREAGVNVFGPGRDGAMLEASKGFAKEFMRRHGIPHPGFRTFDTPDTAVEYVLSTQGPWVIKADGLALGKGVSITGDREQAVSTIKEFMNGGIHGEAGRRLVIEEFLTGREISAMALTDGSVILPLPLAKDHKRVFEGDRGPMTGGMGAVSPVDLGEEAAIIEECIREEILERTCAGLKKDGVDFRGVIYAGLMLTGDGPKVLEYNVRFGDPETQCILPRLEGDFAQVLLACALGKLGTLTSPASGSYAALRARPEACATVVMASGGYPGSYRKGIPITGLDTGAGQTTCPSSTLVFHAGTKRENGLLVTSGGRVLSVTALAPSLDEALRLAYGKVESIKFEHSFVRRDIGK